MKNQLKRISGILFLLTVALGLKAQDTIKLRNAEIILCTVTEIRNTEIEYLPWLDKGKNYHSVNKDLIYYIRYSSGKFDTLYSKPLVTLGKTDSFATPGDAYNAGFKDGFANYDASDERLAGAVSVLVGTLSIIVPIAVSITKIKPSQIKNSQFVNSKDNGYRNGYLAGAKKRRSRAVWSAYGITVGSATAVIGGIIWLVSL